MTGSDGAHHRRTHRAFDKREQDRGSCASSSEMRLDLSSSRDADRLPSRTTTPGNLAPPLSRYRWDRAPPPPLRPADRCWPRCFPDGRRRGGAGGQRGKPGQCMLMVPRRRQRRSTRPKAQRPSATMTPMNPTRMACSRRCSHGLECKVANNCEEIAQLMWYVAHLLLSYTTQRAAAIGAAVDTAVGLLLIPDQATCSTASPAGRQPGPTVKQDQCRNP